MRILFTNNTLDQPAGTELSVYDYASTLVDRGHEVMAFSCQLGEVAERLRKAGVSVADSLSEFQPTPDLIHGHHTWETSLAALQFPDTPVVSFCRGTIPWQESPCLAPNVVRWVGVDEPCCKLIRETGGISADQVELIANGVDLERFPVRGEALPARPERVLVFSNYATEDNFFATVREVCEEAGMVCEGLGAGLKNAVSDPAPVLAAADLVFAKGKAALEAMVTGAGVVVCDENGIGPLVTPDNFAFVRGQSFAYGAMVDPVNPETVRERLGKWNAEEVGEAARLARKEAALESTVDRLEACYRGAITEWEKRDRPALHEFARYAAAFFTEATVAYKLGRDAQEIRRQWRAGEEENETIEMNRILHGLRTYEDQRQRFEEKLDLRDQKIASLRQKLDDARESLDGKKRRWFR